jgi:hypothetical protein
MTDKAWISDIHIVHKNMFIPALVTLSSSVSLVTVWGGEDHGKRKRRGGSAGGQLGEGAASQLVRACGQDWSVESACECKDEMGEVVAQSEAGVREQDQLAQHVVPPAD